MAKQPETAESRLRKKIKQLSGELEGRKALTLDRYPDPTPIDLKAALAASEQKTRFGQPYIEAWVVHPVEGVYRDTVTAKAEHPAFELQVDALKARRNFVARTYAATLVSMDRKISDLESAAPAADAPSSDETTGEQQ